jgi:hypothetical protein
MKTPNKMKNVKDSLKITVKVKGHARNILLALCEYDSQTPEQVATKALILTVGAWSESLNRNRVEKLFQDALQA